MRLVILILLITLNCTSTAYTIDGFCYNQNDAYNCDQVYKCCDRFHDCGTDYNSCLPSNGGVPEQNHCYYLNCQYCCVMTMQSHYCETQ